MCHYGGETIFKFNLMNNNIEVIKEFSKDEYLIYFSPDYYMYYYDGTIYVNDVKKIDIDIPNPSGLFYIDESHNRYGEYYDISLFQYFFDYSIYEDKVYYWIFDNSSSFVL